MIILTNEYSLSVPCYVYVRGLIAVCGAFQGSKDQFFIDGQLLPDHFVTAAKANENLKVEYRLQENYDHGYYFVSTFIASHIDFHLKHLK
jgi:S-formylglutathione hydrolase FrmB